MFQKNTYFCDINHEFVFEKNMRERIFGIWNFIRRNKYAVVIVAFLLIIVFIDQNSLLRRFSQKRQMHDLQEEIDMYRNQIEEGSALLDDIENDEVLRERMARKNYNMSRPDEDVFVFE